MRTLLSKWQVCALLLVGLPAAGCSSIFGGRVINVTATGDLCKKSVEVHMVGVNRFEKDQWETMSMTSYWEPGSKMRKSAAEYTRVIQFGQAPCTKILTKKDSIRKVWKKRKVEYVFVLADLPGIFPDMPGNADARRLRLPGPDSGCWGLRQRKINISIENSNVVPLTIPKSKKCD